METLFQRVAGLDLHKKSIVACIRITDNQGRATESVRTFGTMTDDLRDLSEWMAEHQVTHVAMESTGVLWKPVWNTVAMPQRIQGRRPAHS